MKVRGSRSALVVVVALALLLAETAPARAGERVTLFVVVNGAQRTVLGTLKGPPRPHGLAVLVAP